MVVNYIVVYCCKDMPTLLCKIDTNKPQYEA